MCQLTIQWVAGLGIQQLVQHHWWAHNLDCTLAMASFAGLGQSWPPSGHGHPH